MPRDLTTRGLKFLDVRYTYDVLRDELDAAWHRVMESGTYIGGPELGAFEADFADWCGTAHCVGVANGLDAIVMALRAMGVGRGDEVIVPAHTFIATWLAVVEAGAVPVPVDCLPDGVALDPAAVEAAVTPRCRAIVVVHLHGIPCPVADLRAIADRHGLRLLEDAAQAHGARIGRERVGSLGDAACFSFYPGKNLGAFGDGGALTCSDAELARGVRRLANYGAERKYVHDDRGGNSRLDPLQAAMLRVKLAHMDAWNDRRRAIAAIYSERLAGLADLILPAPSRGTEPVWHLYVVRHPRRERLAAALERRGVPTALHYPVPIHRSGAFAREFGHLSFPVTEAFCAQCLSLPIGPHLTEDDARDIADVVRDTARHVA